MKHKEDEHRRMLREHPLATKDGLEIFLAILFHRGAMCDDCGYGTKVINKRWAKCKKCGKKVQRMTLP